MMIGNLYFLKSFFFVPFRVITHENLKKSEFVKKMSTYKLWRKHKDIGLQGEALGQRWPPNNSGQAIIMPH